MEQSAERLRKPEGAAQSGLEARRRSLLDASCAEGHQTSGEDGTKPAFLEEHSEREANGKRGREDVKASARDRCVTSAKTSFSKRSQAHGGHTQPMRVKRACPSPLKSS